MKIKHLFNKAGRTIKKHAPAVLTGAGVVGLGATAYLAYKSRGKVEEVVIEMEEARENGEEINKVEVARGIAEAVYLPVAVGAASISCILWSYRIQNNRIAVLASTLAATQARNAYFQQKYRDEHGEEAYNKFITPTETVVNKEVTEDGDIVVKTEEIKKEIDSTIGEWYEDSTEYVRDDHQYNMAYIDSINERLQTILFQRGHLMLNEVREALGFERIRNGALLGWSTGDNFDIMKTVTNANLDPEGEMQEQIWITWSTPRYVYNEVDFNGRYSVY